MDKIIVKGARIHNLKNIDVEIPKKKIILVTGISGSGKSSLAFDTIFEEGRTRYLQSIGFPPIANDEKPFDSLEGLSPTIAVEQRTVQANNPRSTVGTKTQLYTMLRTLYTIEGEILCPVCKELANTKGECDLCGMAVDRPTTKHFSYNEPTGMCLKCRGRGYTADISVELVIQDPKKNIVEITKGGAAVFADQLKLVQQLGNFYDFDITTPYKELSPEIQKMFLYGSNKKLPFKWKGKRFDGTLEYEYEGIIPHMERATKESKSAYRMNKMKKFLITQKCDDCNGSKINEEARSIKIMAKNIAELAMMTISELISHLQKVSENSINTPQGLSVTRSLLDRLQNMEEVGLNYLHLHRTLPSLSGGELQRLSLMNHLNAGIDGLIYVLDEPSMSLHENEKENLISIIKKIKDLGNTLILVEHDKKFMKLADIIIDIGPKAGSKGGEVVYQGSLDGIKDVKNSFTGKYLNKDLKFPKKQERDDPLEYISILKASTNNLKEIDVKIPLGRMVGIAGVSGSGKSSLVLDTLVPLLKPHFSRAQQKTKKKKRNGENGDDENGEGFEEYSGSLEGWENLDEIIEMNQRPISRVKTSVPVSYIGIWGPIRELFAKTPEGKKLKLKAGHFSFNSDKGRCEVCKGTGKQDMQINFLTSFSIPCPECKGLRYKPEILDIIFMDKTIAEVLDMTVTEASRFFKGHTKITKVLKVLDDIGMGYMTLGQPSVTLSGGEAQRVKLAKQLGKARKSKSLYILDEPSTGLSAYDTIRLMQTLEKLVQDGNSVLIIEHDPEILSYCDWIIELGPAGGPKGGEIIAEGTPFDIKNNKESNTGKHLVP